MENLCSINLRSSQPFATMPPCVHAKIAPTNVTSSGAFPSPCVNSRTIMLTSIWLKSLRASSPFPWTANPMIMPEIIAVQEITFLEGITENNLNASSTFPFLAYPAIKEFQVGTSFISISSKSFRAEGNKLILAYMSTSAVNV
ncbi:hypothetical protein H5410_011744 [Solanum commersonii]|uniref:Uncharacterized protein n=1 Tax=Solanum commersonii TaxID=4109 RepID=A0A9J6APK3_SOLCO|nr:hypothetical protein H5410_011744 [Solanum commersonii]